jgi:hypothetical protein
LKAEVQDFKFERFSNFDSRLFIFRGGFLAFFFLWVGTLHLGRIPDSARFGRAEDNSPPLAGQTNPRALISFAFQPSARSVGAASSSALPTHRVFLERVNLSLEIYGVIAIPTLSREKQSQVVKFQAPNR